MPHPELDANGVGFRGTERVKGAHHTTVIVLFSNAGSNSVDPMAFLAQRYV
jgi:hypothetical protein